MTTQRNFSGPIPKYKTADKGGGPYATRAKTNFDGGRVTKKGGGNGRKPQMNFGGSMSIPVNFEKGQGQKPGTGSQGGY